MNAHPYLLRFAAGLALLLPAACTSPAPPAPNLTALFADALHCRGDFPDALDLLYRFATPLRIDGSLVNAVRVRGDSGVLVMAYAEGDLEDFARRQGATPHPAERAALDGFGELEVLYSRPLSPRPGLDESPPRLVIGRGIEAAAQAFRWGCRSYDG
ncbi:TPA: hypothetical protein OTY26_004125 [Pseudomonas aeruginosa]|uniref:hypothetical protein n=1 Tax=Pseudomonas aeruginosa TaxID=287 RepID=UPI001F053D93|nr:hypothetical protein [Pseudomonas aeruginosa]MCH0748154.1 hypothetical protein [Pseudomonas aeruginosa]HCT4714495.1 hypothetical protein [Pseudomonas aeruginosa]HCT4758742.1 hypothetical protein [Pseudomonas aeruginosa]